MAWYEYVVVAVALFFAATWAFGLAMSPRNRTGGNIITVVLWWVALSAWFFGDFNALHLLWIFPAALLLPVLLLLPLGRL
jgi:hypothetical protein